MDIYNTIKQQPGKKHHIIRYTMTTLFVCGIVIVMAMDTEQEGCSSLTGIKTTPVNNGSLNDPIKSSGKESINEGFVAGNFFSVLVDNDNNKWFLTDTGIVSYDNSNWKIHNNRKIPEGDLRDFAYDTSSYGKELWIATPAGATVANLPVDARSGATTYHTENSTILSDNVLAVAIGKSTLRWFGTDKGISAFHDKKWLTYSYQRQYPELLFQDYPITAMATTNGGDSLYVATRGAGVIRVFRNDIDAISGASEYAVWGPIEMPSDSVYSICIMADGTQWFGTNRGAARHIGHKTLENWSVFDTNNGLVNNFVQAIASDKSGNIWLGTKGGISVLKGNEWQSLTENDGLLSNNIQCISIDKEGIIWCGTDCGVIRINEGIITNFK